MSRRVDLRPHLLGASTLSYQLCTRCGIMLITERTMSLPLCQPCQIAAAQEYQREHDERA